VLTHHERTDQPVFYESARKSYLESISPTHKKIDQVRITLYSDPSIEKSVMETGVGLLKSPKLMREEIAGLKKDMKDYKDFKETAKEVGHRERLIKQSWRHGVFGIEDSDGKGPSVFYDEVRRRKEFEAEEKEAINVRRRYCKSG
jgi:hypothetical protein